MVWGPMGNCAKRPQSRRPKVGGLKGRSQGWEPRLDCGRVRWVGRTLCEAGQGLQVGTSGG